MYINYIQKYVTTTNASNSAIGGPLEETLHKSLDKITQIAKKNGFNVGLVISPGYLSIKQNTATELVNTLIKNISPNIISNCWILGTMNGLDKYKKPTVLNYTISSFKNLNINASQPKVIQSPIQFARDHRKMFFVILYNKKLILNSKQDVTKFINNITVPIATIGSSNFSKSTYFMGNDHNEADVLWVDDDVLKKVSAGSNANNFNDELIPRHLVDSSNGELPEVVTAKVESLSKSKVQNYLRLILSQTLNTVLV